MATIDSRSINEGSLLVELLAPGPISVQMISSEKNAQTILNLESHILLVLNSSPWSSTVHIRPGEVETRSSELGEETVT